METTHPHRSALGRRLSPSLFAVTTLACASNTASVAFLTALAGLALGLLGFVRGPGWCALIGFVAVVGTIACVGFLTVGIVHVGWTVRRGRRRRRENRVIAALRAGAAV